MFTTEQKSQLAKLLATENLTIQHQKIRTAKFDPTNRILYLPVWQNMTGSLYDLLVGHEVGHALYTPAEGWHDAVTGAEKEKNFKNFLNIVEDARIEKKIQRKYPGLKRHFNQAYKELIERDFFGTKGLDINNLPFIDRLNLFSKSQWTNFSIEFSGEENDFVKQVQSAETWEDVLRITKAIFDYSKEEQKEAMMEMFEPMIERISGDDESGDELDEYESDDYTDEYEDGEDGEEDGDGDEYEEFEDENSDEKTIKGELNRYKESKSTWEDQFSPDSRTDKHFRKNENSLVDEKCKEVVYLTIPKPVLKNIITPAKRVHELHDQYVKEYIEKEWMKPNLPIELLNDFKNRNDRYISLLVKEFEMRKAAKSYNKAKISDTGDIDVGKLASYKFDDNIFRKMMVMPKGKSHGLILLLDKSGSMSNNMGGSIEQILVLTMFCRKVNIPFIVYGFGGEEAVKSIDIQNSPEEIELRKKYAYSNFNNEIGDLSVSKVYLREYLNSKMSNVEFTRAMKHMLLIKKSFEGGRYGSGTPRFLTEQLSNTPLTEALIATAEIMKDFKKKNNLDITNLVIVHDGDADYINSYYDYREDYRKVLQKCWTRIDSYSTNYFVQDTKNNYLAQITKGPAGVNEVVLDWFTKTTGSKVFGFYICDSARGSARDAIEKKFFIDGVPVEELRMKNFSEYQKILKEQSRILKSEKFIDSKNPGFASFFLIAGGNDLNAENDELEIDGKTTTKNMVKAFMKFNKKKAVNRVLVSKFIQGISV